MRSANLALRFILELCLLAALAYCGLQVSILLCVLAPVVAASIWGLFVSPKARFALPRPWWVGIQVVLFGAAVAGLAASGHAVLGVVFGAVTLINLALVLYWHQSDAVATQVSA